MKKQKLLCLNKPTRLILLVLMIAIMLLSSGIGVFASSDIERVRDGIAHGLEALDAASKNKYGDEWVIFTIERSGMSIGDDNKEAYIESVKNNAESVAASKSSPTELAKIVLTLGTLNVDPTNVDGLNFVEMLYNNEKLTEKYTLNGYVWTLVALDSKSYEIPDDAKWSREKLINKIEAFQKEDGGFAITAVSGAVSDPDMTAMAAYALQKHNSSALAGVKTFFEKKGLYDGECTINNSCTAAQILVYLTTSANGQSEDKVALNGISNMASSIYTLKSDNGYKLSSGVAQADTLSTCQSTYALEAYRRHIENRNTLFDLTDAGNKPAKPVKKTHLISSADDFANSDIMDVEEGRYSMRAGETYKLVNDITLSNSISAIKGKLDGNGHTINLDGVNLSDEISETGIVQNLGISTVDCGKLQDKGGVITNLNAGIIRNCSVTGLFSQNTGMAGGIAGIIQNGSKIKNCYFSGTKSGDGTMYGIFCQATDATEYEINHCYYLESSGVAGISADSGSCTECREVSREVLCADKAAILNEGIENTGFVWTSDGSELPYLAEPQTIEEPEEIKVTVTLIGDSEHGEEPHKKFERWISKEAVTLKEGSSGMDAVLAALQANGYEADVTNYGSYIAGIRKPGRDILSEFSNGWYSGWMVKIDGVMIGVSLNQYKLKDGEEIVMFYVDDYVQVGKDNNHLYEQTSRQEPTCTKEGHVIYTCAICGDKKQNKLPVDTKKHRYVLKSEVAATCAATGKRVYKCADCNGTKTNVIPATEKHTYKNEVKRATLNADGEMISKCSKCGRIDSKKRISSPAIIELSRRTCHYNGDYRKPAVTVKDSKGKTLVKNTDYTVDYSKNKNVGEAVAEITFRGSYKGRKTLRFKIRPTKTYITSLKPNSKGFRVRWKKKTAQVSGYEIRYARNSRFDSYKTIKIKSNQTTYRKLTSLKAGKKCYVKVRTYKMVGTTKYVSDWSKVKTVTTR